MMRRIHPIRYPTMLQKILVVFLFFSIFAPSCSAVDCYIEHSNDIEHVDQIPDSQRQQMGDPLHEPSGGEEYNLPPTAVIERISHHTAPPGETVYFYGNSSDPDGYIVDWNWTSSINHLLSRNAFFNTSNLSVGRHTIFFIVTDNMGATSPPANATLIINTPPTADAGAPSLGYLNTPLTFDGSQSKDTDGTIVSYNWNFGDSTTGTGSTPTHTYTALGIYTVTLTVTDDLDGTDTVTTTATIVGTSPVANAGGPYNSTINHTILFNGSKSKDLDGTLVSYEWDFGDGTHGTGVITIHSYVHSGSYTVNLKVTDNNGYSGRDITVAIITPSPNNQPSKPAVTIVSEDNTTFSFLLNSSDPDQDNLCFILDWGDTTSKTTPVFPSGTILIVTHTWATPGEYTIKVIAKDEHNTTSNVTELTIVVNSTTISNGSNTSQPPQQNNVFTVWMFFGLLSIAPLATVLLHNRKKKKQSTAARTSSQPSQQTK